MALPTISKALASTGRRHALQQLRQSAAASASARSLSTSASRHQEQKPVPNPPPTTALPDKPTLASQAAAAVTHPTPASRGEQSRSSSGSSGGTGALAKIVSYSLFLFGSTFLVTYYLDSRSAIHRWVAMPFLHSFVDAEDGQKLAIKLLKTGLAPKDYTGDDDALATELFGQKLANPIGLAAGFDKQAEAIDGLFDLGFGIVEIGSVTPQPQPGNDKPRYFRIPSHSASINRFGFNSDGHALVLERLLSRVRDYLIQHPDLIPANFLPDPRSPEADPRLSRHQAIELAATRLTQSPATVATLLDHHGLPRSLRPGRMLSVNLGKNKTSTEEDASDFVKGVETFGPLADMLVVNVSSPNTPGLRNLQKKESLQKLLATLVQARDGLPARLNSNVKKVPLVVKIAPDLSSQELDDVASVIVDAGIDGVIISNTTVQRPQEISSTLPAKELPVFSETGGLSGPPLRPISRKAFQQVVGRLRAADKEVIAAGGISTPEDVLDATRDGASAIQVYTAFGWQGVGMVSRWKEELRALIASNAPQGEHSLTWKYLSHESRVSVLKAEEERKRIAKKSFQDESSRVRQELNDLKKQLGGAGRDADDNADDGIFYPDASDTVYNDLLRNTRSALGLSEPQRAAKPSPSTQLRHTETPPTITLQSSGSTATSPREDRGNANDRTVQVVSASDDPVEVSVAPVKVYGKRDADKTAEELRAEARAAGGAAAGTDVGAVVQRKVFEGVDRARKV